MTRDDYIKLHRDTVAAIDLADTHGEENCIIEHSGNGDGWSETYNPVWSANFYRARLKPTKKIVPWTSLEEVPLTHWFQKRGHHDLIRVAQVDPDDTRMPVCIEDEWLTLGDLCDNYFHAMPCDDYRKLIWLPCGNEVVE